jgi:hypothetical protein
MKYIAILLLAFIGYNSNAQTTQLGTAVLNTTDQYTLDTVRGTVVYADQNPDTLTTYNGQIYQGIVDSSACSIVRQSINMSVSSNGVITYSSQPATTILVITDDGKALQPFQTISFQSQ